MKVAAITVRAGTVLEHNNKLWIVLKSEIFNPGKGASVVQVAYVWAPIEKLAQATSSAP